MDLGLATPAMVMACPLIVCMLSLLCFPPPSQAEVFSSVAQMTSLIGQERKLLDHLQRIVNISKLARENGKRVKRLERNLKCLEHRHGTAAETSDLLHNPVAGFRLIRRLIQDWNHVINASQPDTPHAKSKNVLDGNLLNMKEVLSQWQRWPRESDVSGAMLALVRIGHVYDLYPAPGRLRTNNSLHNLPFIHWSQVDVSDNTEQSSINADHYKDTPCEEQVSSTHHSSVTSMGTCISETDKFKAKCHFGYNELNGKDLLDVAKVAADYSFPEEADRWLRMAFAALRMGHEKDVSLLSEAENLQVNLKRQPSGNATPILEDTIHGQYMVLCRNALQNAPVTLRQATERTLFCKWSNVWPYVRYKTEILHSSPEVTRFYDVISNDQMEHVKVMVGQNLSPSQLPAIDQANNKAQLLRVSQTAWLSDVTDVLRKLSRRIGEVTGLDTGQLEVDTAAEPYQVVNYGLGGMYAPHEDSTRASRALGKENNPSLRNAGDRLATWMFYLTEVQLGGATVFPSLNLSVQPVKGSAVLWYNLRKNGAADTRMVHAGCPVVLGDKWVANKWIRELRQTFHRPCSTSSTD